MCCVEVHPHADNPSQGGKKGEMKKVLARWVTGATKYGCKIIAWIWSEQQGKKCDTKNKELKR